VADNFQTQQVTTPGATFASDEISGTHHQRVKTQYGADGSATDVSPISPLPAEPIYESPQVSYATSASVSAGSSADLDSAQIGSGLTGRLVGLWIGASVPVKVEIYTVTNAVASSIQAVIFRSAGETDPVPIPRQFFSVAHDAGAGFDGFRVTVTNLDTGSGSSDLHATFFWDES